MTDQLQPGAGAALIGRIEERFTPPDDHYRVFVVGRVDVLTDHNLAWDLLTPVTVLYPGVEDVN